MLDTEEIAPWPDARLDSGSEPQRRMDGMIRRNGEYVPGAILGLWLELRKHVGVVAAKKKEGVKFKVRSAEDLIDKIREKANKLGILIYPARASGKGHVVEDGTLAEQELVVQVQAVEDGSILRFAGFGLGADTQDKAGGKAGTYAYKQALIQALLAGGKENAKALGVADTDDSDTPIEGGVRAKTPGKKKAPTADEVKSLFEQAADATSYNAAVAALKLMSPDAMTKFDRDVIRAAQARCGIEPTKKA